MAIQFLHQEALSVFGVLQWGQFSILIVKLDEMQGGKIQMKKTFLKKRGTCLIAIECPPAIV